MASFPSSTRHAGGPGSPEEEAGEVEGGSNPLKIRRDFASERYLFLRIAWQWSDCVCGKVLGNLSRYEEPALKEGDGKNSFGDLISAAVGVEAWDVNQPPDDESSNPVLLHHTPVGTHSAFSGSATTTRHGPRV